MIKLPFSLRVSSCRKSYPSYSTVSKSLIPLPLLRSLGFKSQSDPLKTSSGTGLMKGLYLLGDPISWKLKRGFRLATKLL